MSPNRDNNTNSNTNPSTNPDNSINPKSSILLDKDKIDLTASDYETLIKVRHEDIKRILTLLPVSVLTDHIKLLFTQNKPSRFSSFLSTITNLLFFIVLG